VLKKYVVTVERTVTHYIYVECWAQSTEIAKERALKNADERVYDRRVPTEYKVVSVKELNDE
jgi:hypothetical protein